MKPKPTSPRGAAIWHLNKGFLDIARECLGDARKLDDGSQRFEPLQDTGIPNEVLLRDDTKGKYILTAHALELGLKAFLVKHGFSEKEVIRYGHNLDRLYSKAVDLGLEDRSEVRDTILWINVYHDKGALLRYGKTNLLPQCKTLFPIIEALLVKSEPSSSPQGHTEQ